MEAFKKMNRFFDRRFIAFCHDSVMVAAAWLCAYVVRFNLSSVPPAIFKEAILWLPVVILIQVSFFMILGLYRSVWRFASIPDLIQIIKAVLLGVLTLTFYMHYISTAVAPRSVPLLYTLFLLLFLSFGRLAVRWFRDRRSFFQPQIAKRVLIVGSDDMAESLIREMLRDTKSLYRPVAIVDSDLTKRNREIHRIRILGSFNKIKLIVESYKIETIFIALSQVSAAEMRIILQECNSAAVPYRIISSFADKAQDGQLLASLREVNLDDLLGRETYQVDMRLFAETICNKKVLVTGGGGSIGSELCRQIATLNPAELLIIDHSEANLYHIELELHKRFPTLPITVALINILQLSLLEAFFKKHLPHFVFHAAAYKHVPLLERQIIIAVRNNVMGSKNVIDMAIKYHVSTFVQISTDKAVNPTNIMGMTKRVAEIYSQNLQRQTRTKVITVRFGNVLGSVGSVVPLFKEQLQKGGPLTVTHPDITRYFMTIPEASRLILQAMTMGEGGEIFVLDMGEPIKIKNLAEQMIRLSGKKIEEVGIVYTGLRPGEKLWEELFYSAEEMKKTHHKKIFQAKAGWFDSDFIANAVSLLIERCEQQEESAVLEVLLQLVPEYSKSQSVQAECV